MGQVKVVKPSMQILRSLLRDKSCTKIAGMKRLDFSPGHPILKTALFLLDPLRNILHFVVQEKFVIKALE
jgi:hypothetical protein